MCKHRKLTLLMLLLLLAVEINAQRTASQYNSFFGSVRINKTNNTIVLKLWNSDEYKNHEAPFQYLEESKIPFIIMDGKRFLFLHSLYFIDIWVSDDELLFDGISASPRAEDFWYYAKTITASSFLTEGIVEYIPDNLQNAIPNTPWVEGVPGSGIDERITLEWDIDQNNPITALSFFNGFISYSKPNLYDRNNRVKTVSILIDDQFIMDAVAIEDTPNPQIIILSHPVYHKIDIIIEAVYPGTQWDDTCIEAIHGLGVYLVNALGTIIK